MIKNTFWFRHFLLCDRLAKKMCDLHGWQVENFADTIQQEEAGRIGNNQMTKYFWAADEMFCELHSSDEGYVFEFLEDEGLSMSDLAKLTEAELEKYYYEYCSQIKFN